jgi:hypothetical protein
LAGILRITIQPNSFREDLADDALRDLATLSKSVTNSLNALLGGLTRRLTDDGRLQLTQCLQLLQLGRYSLQFRARLCSQSTGFDGRHEIRPLSLQFLDPRPKVDRSRLTCEEAAFDLREREDCLALVRSRVTEFEFYLSHGLTDSAATTSWTSE